MPSQPRSVKFNPCSSPVDQSELFFNILAFPPKFYIQHNLPLIEPPEKLLSKKLLLTYLGASFILFSSSFLTFRQTSSISMVTHVFSLILLIWVFSFGRS